VKQSDLTLRWVEPPGVKNIITYILKWGVWVGEGSNTTESFAADVTARSHAIGDLLPGTLYLFEVEAIAITGQSFISQATFATIPKATAPTALFLPKGMQEEINLNWTAPNNTWGFLVVDYLLRWKLPVQNETYWQEFTTGGNDTWGVFQNLAAGVEYDVAVAAITESGEGEFSVTLTQPTVPQPPSPEDLVLVDIEATTAHVTWRAPEMPRHGLTPAGASIIQDHRVRLRATGDFYGDLDFVADSGSLANSSLVRGLRPGTIYKIAVAAITDTGLGEYSLPVVATTCTGTYFASPGAHQILEYGDLGAGPQFSPRWLGDQRTVGYQNPVTGSSPSCPEDNTLRVTRLTRNTYTWNDALEKPYTPEARAAPEQVYFSAALRPADIGRTRLFLRSSDNRMLAGVELTGGQAVALNQQMNATEPLSYTQGTWVLVVMRLRAKASEATLVCLPPDPSLEEEVKSAGGEGEGGAGAEGRECEATVSLSLNGGPFTEPLRSNASSLVAAGDVAAVSLALEEDTEQYNSLQYVPKDFQQTAWVDSVIVLSTASPSAPLHESRFGEVKTYNLTDPNGEFQENARYGSASMTAPQNCPDLQHSLLQWDLLQKPDVSLLETSGLTQNLSRYSIIDEYISHHDAWAAQDPNGTAVAANMLEDLSKRSWGEVKLTAPIENAEYVHEEAAESSWTATSHGALRFQPDVEGEYTVTLLAQGVCARENSSLTATVRAVCNAPITPDVAIFQTHHPFHTTCLPELHFNGGSTRDPDGVQSTFFWKIWDVPWRALNTTPVFTSFPHLIVIPDVLGEYAVNLWASDGCSVQSERLLIEATWSPSCSSVGLFGSVLFLVVVLTLALLLYAMSRGLNYAHCHPLHPATVTSDVNSLRTSIEVRKHSRAAALSTALDRKRLFSRPTYADRFGAAAMYTTQAVTLRLNDRKLFNRLLVWFGVLSEAPWLLSLVVHDFGLAHVPCKRAVIPAWLSGTGASEGDMEAMTLALVGIAGGMALLHAAPLMVAAAERVQALSEFPSMPYSEEESVRKALWHVKSLRRRMELLMAHGLLQLTFSASLSSLVCTFDDQRRPFVFNSKIISLKCWRPDHILLALASCGLAVFFSKRAFEILAAKPVDPQFRLLPQHVPLQIFCKCVTIASCLLLEADVAKRRREQEASGDAMLASWHVDLYCYLTSGFLGLLLLQHLVWQSVKGETHTVSTVRAALYGLAFGGSVLQIQRLPAFKSSSQLPPPCGGSDAALGLSEALLYIGGGALAAVVANVACMRRVLLPLGKDASWLFRHGDVRARTVAYLTLYKELEPKEQALETLDRQSLDVSLQQLELMARTIHYDLSISGASVNIVDNVFSKMGQVCCQVSAVSTGREDPDGAHTMGLGTRPHAEGSALTYEEENLHRARRKAVLARLLPSLIYWTGNAEKLEQRGLVRIRAALDVLNEVLENEEPHIRRWALLTIGEISASELGARAVLASEDREHQRGFFEKFFPGLATLAKRARRVLARWHGGRRAAWRPSTAENVLARCQDPDEVVCAAALKAASAFQRQKGLEPLLLWHGAVRTLILCTAREDIPSALASALLSQLAGSLDHLPDILAEVMLLVGEESRRNSDDSRCLEHGLLFLLKLYKGQSGVTHLVSLEDVETLVYSAKHHRAGGVRTQSFHALHHLAQDPEARALCIEAQLHTVVLDLATSDPEWDVRSAANEALAALQKSDDGAEAIRLYRERYGEDGSRVPAVERQEALAHLQKTVQYWQRKVQAKSKGRIAMMLRQARAQGKATVKSAW